MCLPTPAFRCCSRIWMKRRLIWAGKIRKNYASSVQRGRFTQEFMDEPPVADHAVLHRSRLRLRCGHVVEAVFERHGTEEKCVFADLDQACKGGAILASNTSTLNIDEIGAATSRPEAVDRNPLLSVRPM